jgi:hypothetical protein
MKVLLRILLLGATLSGLCACESELPSRGPSLSERVEKGIRGEGSLFIRSKESGDPRDAFASPNSSR